MTAANRIAFSENGMYTEVEAFDFAIFDLEHNSGEIVGIVRIDVGKIGLLLKYCDPSFFCSDSWTEQLWQERRIISLYFV